LDSDSEKQVHWALDKAHAGRTTIMIVHRLSTIQGANLIVFVKDGQIVERGQHYQLVDLGSMYADFCAKLDLEISH